MKNKFKKAISFSLLFLILIIYLVSNTVLSASQISDIAAEVKLKVENSVATVLVSSSSSNEIKSYSYYVLKNGTVAASEPYSKKNTFEFIFPDNEEYRLRVYLQTNTNKRTVLERTISNEDIDEIGSALDMLFEAEDGELSGNVKVASSRSGYSGTGYVTGFHQSENDLWSLSIQVPQSNHYTLTVKAASDSYKVNYLTLNGQTVGKIETQGTGLFEEITFEGVYIYEGSNTLSITTSWGWFDIDCIRITGGQSIDSSYYDITGTLANPNANEHTQKIMQYLTGIYGQKTLAGQYTDHGKSTEIDAIYELTGKYPALRGFDFIFYSPNSTWPEGAKDTDLALEWDKSGGLSTFSWHWHGPIGNSSFYTSDTDFDLSDAVTDKSVAQKSLSELQTMLNNGEITNECYAIIRDIDAISAQLSILQDNNVTVLWRPLHEASGGWFWWGAKGAEPYKWLWNVMFERQTYYHKLDNLIWVWNGQDADWYPGDDVVDIIGYDIYISAHDYSALSDSFVATAEMAESKPVALTENGVVPDPDLLDRDNTHWLWFNTWCREYVVDSNGEYSESYTEAEMLKKVYSHDSIITRDELPNFN